MVPQQALCPSFHPWPALLTPFSTLILSVPCVQVKCLQLCPNLCYPTDSSLPGSSLPVILQAQILEWVAMPSPSGIFLTQGSNPPLLCLPNWQSGPLPVVPPGKPHSFCSVLFSSLQSLSRVRLFATPWTAAGQSSLSITNSRSLLKLAHRVSDAIQLSHPLSSPSPPAPNPSQHQGLFH